MSALACKRVTIGQVILAAMLLTACGKDAEPLRFSCDEPLGPYLGAGRSGQEDASDSSINQQILEVCPAKGFHRRFVFSFPRAALASRQAVDAQLVASWCIESDHRTTQASLSVSPARLVFRFQYPWPTETGKLPRTEFRINRGDYRGGFFDDLDWNCAPDRSLEATE